ncbi:outer membrane beta-barrel protein, partial [Algoriphagus sp.]|uniref:outer membrane beta-barrel protein n=1 Tax=Algoriphagus sp. TaxID=1872435 RepID=UPI0025FB3D49
MKTTNLLFLTLFTYLLGMSNLAAKDVSKISGKILDQNGQTVPYANVALIAVQDGHLVDGAVSDEDGLFLIESTKTEKVKLVISSIGFKPFESEAFDLKPGIIKEMGEVVVQDEATGLEEVTVQSTRPEIIIEPDKTIVNVEGTVMAEGATALDVIGRSPGIYVDQDGIINLNGRTGVVVMINDRQTYMSATDLANFLRAMPADNIKNIEVINNPSARFDAEGSAGVINIKLKKNTVDGVFGNVQAGGQYNGFWAPIAGISLNVKKGKWSTNADLNYNHNANLNELDIERNFEVEEGVSNFMQESRIKQRDKNLFFNGAANYEINKNHNIGLNIQASDFDNTTTNPSLTDITTPGIAETTYLDSYNDSRGGGNRFFGNLHYGGNLDTLGTKLTSDFDFTRMNSGSESLLSTSTWTGDDQSDLASGKLNTLNDMFYNIFTAKVDLVKPLWKGTLETGVKGSWVKSDNNLDLSRSIEDGPFEPDPSSNHFIYNENVLAGYLSYKGKFSEKVSYQAGLRGEYSDIKGNSITLDQINTQEYFNLFPSAFIQHKVSDNYQIVYNA